MKKVWWPGQCQLASWQKDQNFEEKKL